MQYSVVVKFVPLVCFLIAMRAIVVMMVPEEDLLLYWLYINEGWHFIINNEPLCIGLIMTPIVFILFKDWYDGR